MNFLASFYILLSKQTLHFLTLVPALGVRLALGNEFYSLEVWIETFQESGYSWCYRDAVGATSASYGVQEGPGKEGPPARDTQQDDPAVLRAQPYELLAAPSNLLQMGWKQGREIEDAEGMVQTLDGRGKYSPNGEHN